MSENEILAAFIGVLVMCFGVMIWRLVRAASKFDDLMGWGDE